MRINRYLYERIIFNSYKTIQQKYQKYQELTEIIFRFVFLLLTNSP